MSQQPFSRGARVRYMFDTGAFGVSPIYGTVVSAGPATFTVEWESGLRNRCRQLKPPATLRLIDEAEWEEVRR